MTDEVPEWAKAEIAAAVRILKDDGVHVHKMMGKFGAKKDDPPEGTDAEGDDTAGKPPPKKEKKDGDAEPPKAKRSLWWGERANET
jgi:hypothetical protein